MGKRIPRRQIADCLSPHPLGGTGIQCTSHTFERSTSGHCAATRLRILARSSSGVRDSGFSIIDSLSRSSLEQPLLHFAIDVGNEYHKPRMQRLGRIELRKSAALFVTRTKSRSRA
jgi:hypothetical protein